MLNADGAGNFSLTEDHNFDGHIGFTTVTGTYTVDSDGRVTMTGGMDLMMYLLGPNHGFVTNTNAVPSRGVIGYGYVEPQTATSVAGTFVYNTTIGWYQGKSESGRATLGANGDGTLDINNGGDPSTFQKFTGTYTIGSDGRGTITLTAPSARTMRIYVISPTHFVAIDSVDPDDYQPALLDFIQ